MKEIRVTMDVQSFSVLLKGNSLELSAVEIEAYIYKFMQFSEGIGFKKGVEAAARVAYRIGATATIDRETIEAADRIRALLDEVPK